MKKANLSYIYSRSAAQRMFNAEVKSVQIYKNAIFVVFKEGQGMRPRFVPKSVFKEHFAEYRKQSASQIYVAYTAQGYFRAPSSNLQESYRIELYPEHLECSCSDWRTQEELGISKPTCKHCYAVLDYIGCNSLEDYINRDGFSFLNDNPLEDWQDELMAQENYRF